MSLLADAVAFQQLLKQLGLLAADDVTAMWQATEGWEQVELLYPAIAEQYASAAGTLAAQWYYEINPDQPFETRTAPLPERTQLLSSVGWAFTQQQPLPALIGSTERHIFGTARRTVVENASRENVRYARYASANACPWCRVLATNPARYRSEETAVAGHDNCNCLAVPVREGTEWTPPPYVAQWEQQYLQARAEVGGNLNDIAAYIRAQN